jgi:SPP1 gp7 family putative phage head morphogenesis protein
MPPPDDWEPPKRILTEYVGQIEALIGKLNQYAHQPMKLAALSVQPAFRQSAQTIAQNMAGRVLRSNARSWRAAARRASHGRMIYEALRRELQGPVGQAVAEIIRENSLLISSLPVKLAEQTALYIGKRQSQGVRSEAITQELQLKLPHLAKSRIHLIARTETAKAETAITQARAENIGVDWYEWRTSEDGRVRKSHRKMDGVLCAFSDPPSPEQLTGEPSAGAYPPGGIYNCRCLALPVIDIREISFPRRVYYGGHLQRMGKTQFMRIAGMRKAA